MTTDENEDFIRSNFSSLMSSGKVKAKTGAIEGEWKLNEISGLHENPRNIKFTAVLENGLSVLRVMAIIDRQTAKVTVSEVEDI